MTTDAATRLGPVLAVVRRLAALLLRALFRIRVHGVEHLPADGPVLLAGNHSSFLDGPIVYILLPRTSAFLVKSEIYTGALRHLLDRVHQIPVHRGTPDRTALRRGCGVLTAGGVLGMFPEGTRGTGGFQTIQHGIGYIAAKAQCPIVPVAVLGSGAALPVGRHLPKLRSRIDVVLGPAFEVEVTGDPSARRTWSDAAEQIRVHLLCHLERASGLTGQPMPAAART